jgi:hypothetical protein
MHPANHTKNAKLNRQAFNAQIISALSLSSGKASRECRPSPLHKIFDYHWERRRLAGMNILPARRRRSRWPLDSLFGTSTFCEVCNTEPLIWTNFMLRCLCHSP